MLILSADNDLLDTAKREAREELGQLPHFQLRGEILTKCALSVKISQDVTHTS